MAKVSVIKTEIKGIEYNININVNSRGIFSCKIPQQVSDDLRIEIEHTSFVLNELESKIKSFIDTYKNSVTTYEIFILVAYQACGDYIKNIDGGHLFYYNDDNYKIQTTFSEIDNAIGLDFKVAIKETIDGKDEWFIAKKNDDGEFTMPCKHTHSYRGVRVSRSFLKRAKAIPFTNNALNTLLGVQEKFRALSELLFKFITKDNDEIVTILNTNRLLN